MSRSAHLEALLAKPGMAKLVVTFVSKLGERCDSIRSAADARDYDALKRLAHQLKGAAGGYGFPAIGDAAAAIERVTPRTATSLPDLIKKLADLCEQARCAVPNPTSATPNAA
ncbi:MAG: Hpt domain-containing protein [Tepidisphaeraceae bacterium]